MVSMRSTAVEPAAYVNPAAKPNPHANMRAVESDTH